MKSSGFTLLELLVTMSIVSVLTAVAIPEFKAYRQRAYDIRAQVDLRSVALAEEAHFFDFERYLSCVGEQCTELPGIAGISNGVEIEVIAEESDFSAESSHKKGTGRVYRWDTRLGGPQTPRG